MITWYPRIYLNFLENCLSERGSPSLRASEKRFDNSPWMMFNMLFNMLDVALTFQSVADKNSLLSASIQMHAVKDPKDSSNFYSLLRQ